MSEYTPPIPVQSFRVVVPVGDTTATLVPAVVGATHTLIHGDLQPDPDTYTIAGSGTADTALTLTMAACATPVVVEGQYITN
jgi:hypothetical protein